MDVDTGDIATKWPHFNNKVYGIVSDGAGGWYVSGEFTKVQNQTQAYVAHINSDGSLEESFDPVFDVSMLAPNGGDSIPYASGAFVSSAVGSTTCNYVAAFSTTSVCQANT